MSDPRLIRRFLLAGLPLLLAFGFAPVHAQQAQSAPLQERMSYAQFKRLGLDKLTPAQLDTLNAWLRKHGDRGPSMEAAAVPSRQPATAQPNTTNSGDIHTRIDGTFRGWDADTVFTLANGQRWRVVDDSQQMMHSMHNPKVTLRKGFFGSWLLSVDGTSQSVRVSLEH
jgi:hypothetical protein